jgi:hypothetical protein
MKKKNLAEVDVDPMDRESDLSNSYPNPFVELLGDLRNVVILAPDVLEAFPNSTAVNHALRELIAERAKTAIPKVKRASFEVRTKKKHL